MDGLSSDRVIEREQRFPTLHWPSFWATLLLEAAGVTAFVYVARSNFDAGQFSWDTLLYFMLPIAVVGWLFLLLPFLVQGRASEPGFAGRWAVIALLRAVLLLLWGGPDWRLQAVLAAIAAFWFLNSYWLYRLCWVRAVRSEAGPKHRLFRLVPESLCLLAELFLLTFLMPATGTSEDSWIPLVAWVVPLVFVLIRADRRRRLGAPLGTAELLGWAAFRVGAFVGAAALVMESRYDCVYVMGPVEPGYEALSIFLLTVPPIYFYQVFCRTPRPDARPLPHSLPAALTAIGAEHLTLGFLSTQLMTMNVETYLHSNFLFAQHASLFLGGLFCRLPPLILQMRKWRAWAMSASAMGIAAILIFQQLQSDPLGWKINLLQDWEVLLLFPAAAIVGTALYRCELHWRARAGMEH